MTTDLNRRLSLAVERHQAEYMALLAELVRYSSALGSERPAQEHLLRQVRSMASDAELWDVDPERLCAILLLLRRMSRSCPT